MNRKELKKNSTLQAQKPNNKVCDVEITEGGFVILEVGTEEEKTEDLSHLFSKKGSNSNGTT